MTRLKDIFEVNYGTQLDFNKMKICDKNSQNGIDFVSRQTKNNGVVTKVYKYNNIKPLKPGLITVTLGGAGVLTSYVQPHPFYTAQNIAVLKPRIELSLKEKLYYCACIEKNRYKYSAFGREANKTLSNINIPDSIPDWIYKFKIPAINNLKKPALKIPPLKLNTDRWKNFKSKNLFNIRGGKGPKVGWAENNPGETPFISAIGNNNGIRAYVDYEPTHPGNTITVVKNGSNVGKAFYQKTPFCATGDILILKPKEKLNVYIALFISTLINRETYRYNHARKWTVNRMKNFKFQLPASGNKPNWKFMETFIKSLKYTKHI